MDEGRNFGINLSLCANTHQTVGGESGGEPKVNKMYRRTSYPTVQAGDCTYIKIEGNVLQVKEAI